MSIERPFSLIRALCDLRDRQIQKARIQFSNRIFALESGNDHATKAEWETCQKYLDVFQKLEEKITQDIRLTVRDEAIFNKMKGVVGIGEILAAKLIAMIEIERCNTISSLWRYAGFGVIDQKAEKRIRGEPMHYNMRLKAACWLVGTSFLRCGKKSPYASLYYERKERYSIDRPSWTKFHIHRAAMRYMIKQFLSDLWLEWRSLSNLPIRDPYCFEKQGHTTIRDRDLFGWGIKVSKRQDSTMAKLDHKLSISQSTFIGMQG
jgi:hypothetical protein